MFPFPHTGRVRLYVDTGQDPKQATEFVARLVGLGIAESAIHEVCLDFSDDDHDGSSSLKNKILEDAQAGRYEVLVVVSLDRLGTDAVELSRVLTQLDDAGVLVISLAEGFCTDASLTPIFFPITANIED